MNLEYANQLLDRFEIFALSAEVIEKYEYSPNKFTPAILFISFDNKTPLPKKVVKYLADEIAMTESALEFGDIEDHGELANLYKLQEAMVYSVDSPSGLLQNWSAIY